MGQEPETAVSSSEPSGRARAGRRKGPTKGDLKEAAILDCAWELLATKPMADITIEELAKGAGLSRSAFYFYFDSREAAIRALATRVADDIFDTVSGMLLDAPGSPEQVTRRIVTAYVDRWLKQGRVLRAMVPLYESDPEHRMFWDGITSQIVGGIAHAIAVQRAAGLAIPAPPAEDDLARALVAMMWRSGYEISLEKLSPPALQRRIDALVAVSLRAIYGS